MVSHSRRMRRFPEKNLPRSVIPTTSHRSAARWAPCAEGYMERVQYITHSSRVLIQEETLVVVASRINRLKLIICWVNSVGANMCWSQRKCKRSALLVCLKIVFNSVLIDIIWELYNIVQLCQAGTTTFGYLHKTRLMTWLPLFFFFPQ